MISSAHALPDPGRNLVIGFFDSGIGGLSVWQAVLRRLPQPPTLYLADSVHCPYGPRPVEQIRRFSLGIARFLIAGGAGLVVVACNTASAAALESLRAELDVPIVGMEPAVKPAAERTQTGHVGVLATRGTVNGHLFRNTTARYAHGVTVHVQIGEGLVERVEAGQTDTPETLALLRRYLQPMLAAGADQIVLGCTHYAFLTPIIQPLLPSGVSIIDPAAAVARRVEQVVASAGSAASRAGVSGHSPMRGARFFTTGSPQVLAAVAGELTGQEPEVVKAAWDPTETFVVCSG